MYGAISLSSTQAAEGPEFTVKFSVQAADLHVPSRGHLASGSELLGSVQHWPRCGSCHGLLAIICYLWPFWTGRLNSILPF
jgi:hypothetical protein